MSPEQSWKSLRDDLAADPAPVKPLRPLRALAPWGLLIVLGLLTVLIATVGLREDAASLGPIWLWLPSLIELAMAVWLLAAGLEETTPGRGLNKRMVAVGVGTGILTHCAVTVLTQQKGSGLSTGSMAAGKLFSCFGAELLLAIPILVVAALILRRGLTTRPARAGIAVGIGAGVCADALWRLICPYGDFRHVLSAHLTSIICVLFLGWLVGYGWDRWRLRNWRRKAAPPSSPSS